MTHLFSCVAILLTGVAVVTALVASSSKTELRTDLHEATAYMETRVDRSLSDMQKKFESLAGEALKKPSVLVFCSSLGPLSGQTFDALPGGILSMGGLLAKNVGDKKTDSISARLLSTVSLTARWGDWEPSHATEPGYPFAYSLASLKPGISPGDSATLDPDFTLQFNSQIPRGSSTGAVVKLKVFYGGEKPTEVTFQVNAPK